MPQLISALAPPAPHVGRDDLKGYRHIDDRRALAAITLDYAVVFVVAGVAIWANRIPVTLLAMVLIAGRQSALQGLVHSACHYSLFSRRRWNDHLEFLYAYPVLDSVPLYREQHKEHHRAFSLRTPDRFDYLLQVLQLGRQGFWPRTWLVFIKPLIGYSAFTLVSDVVRTLRAHPGPARKLITYWTVLLAVAWLGGWLQSLLLYWIAPLLWLYPVLDIWAELSDHLDARDGSRNQEGFFYSLMLKGHETYHAVHHLYPFVPYYRLRDLGDRLRNSGVVMESSRGPLDFLRIVYGSGTRRAGV
jgi:fatty acid desaturase